jgi:DNA-binding response OmpR family regulator
MRHAGVILSREHLLGSGWESDGVARSDVVASYVSLLRRKVDAPFGTASIETVRGVGYRLREGGNC